MTVPDRTLREAVLEDIRCHRENGVDLNPYSTQTSRSSWANGFAGRPRTMTDYIVAHARGRLAASLIKEAQP
jgi:hypothetical protein